MFALNTPRSNFCPHLRTSLSIRLNICARFSFDAQTTTLLGSLTLGNKLILLNSLSSGINVKLDELAWDMFAQGVITGHREGSSSCLLPRPSASYKLVEMPAAAKDSASHSCSSLKKSPIRLTSLLPGLSFETKLVMSSVCLKVRSKSCLSF